MNSLVRCGLVVGALWAWSGAAWAQSDATRAAARDLGAEGVEDYQAGNYSAASQKLGRAFEILRAPTLGLWSARALAKEGKLVEASERYLAVTRLDAGTGDVKVQQQAKAEAASEREALQPRIPSLTIDVKGAGSELALTLDGAPLAPALLGVRQPANPGRHVVEAREAGKVTKKEVTLAEGQRAQVTLDMKTAVVADPGESAPASAPTEPAAPADAPPPEPAAPPSGDSDALAKPGLPAGFWAGVALAGVGVAVGGVTAGLAASKKSDLGCSNDVCPSTARSDVDSHNGLLTVSTVGFVAAGVGAATAAVFLLTRPSAPKQARRITPWVGVGSAGVVGTF